MSEILLSQLAHVELISPRPAETVKWMVDVLGLEETTREGQSVYLRGWAEWLHSSLIVTEGPRPRWRTSAGGPTAPRTRRRSPSAWSRDSGRLGRASVGRGRALPLPRARRGPPARGVLGGRALRGAEREARARPALPPAAVPGARRRGALHRPRHDRHAGHARRHRLLQDARPRHTGVRSTPSRASTSSPR